MSMPCARANARASGVFVLSRLTEQGAVQDCGMETRRLYTVSVGQATLTVYDLAAVQPASAPHWTHCYNASNCGAAIFSSISLTTSAGAVTIGSSSQNQAVNADTTGRFKTAGQRPPQNHRTCSHESATAYGLIVQPTNMQLVRQANTTISGQTCSLKAIRV